MSFADLLEQEKRRTPLRTIDKILAALNEADRAAALEAIRDPGVGPTTIARILTKLCPDFTRGGSDYSPNVVVVHPEFRFGG